MRNRLLVAAAVALIGSGCGQATVEPGESLEPGGEAPAEAGAGWERLSHPPLTRRVGSVVTAVSGQVLVAGGWEFLCPPNADCAYPDTPLLRDGALLEVESGRWRPIADAPFGIRDGDAAAMGDEVLVLTGCRSSKSCDGPLELLSYDTATDRWRELGRVPGPAPSYAALVPVGDRVLVLADSDESGERRDHLYDPATGRWETLPDDPLPLVYDRWAVDAGDRLMVFGSPMSDEAENKLGAAYDLATGTWTRLPEAPGGGYQVWRSGDEAWLNPHFGTDGGGVLDLRSDTWGRFPDPPEDLGEDEALDIAGLIGWGQASYEYSSGLVRDTQHDRWFRIPKRTSAAYDERLTALDDALVVFGGQRWQDSDGELLAETWIWRP